MALHCRLHPAIGLCAGHRGSPAVLSLHSSPHTAAPQGDAAASQLYLQYGYMEVARDNPIAARCVPVWLPLSVQPAVGVSCLHGRGLERWAAHQSPPRPRCPCPQAQASAAAHPHAQGAQRARPPLTPPGLHHQQRARQCWQGCMGVVGPLTQLFCGGHALARPSVAVTLVACGGLALQP